MHRLALLLVVAPLAPVGQPGAQQFTAAVDAGVSSVAYDEYARSSAFVVAPTLQVSAERARFEARSALSLFEGGSRSAQAGGAGRYLTPVRNGLAAELGAEGGATLYNAVTPIAYGRAELLGHFRPAAEWGVWAGPTVGVVADDPGRRWVAGASVGAWGANGHASYGCRVTPTRVGALLYTDGELWGGWERGRVELSATAGARQGELGVGARAWVNGGASVWLGRHYALVAGVGTYPADLAQGVPGGRFATLAVRLRSRPRLSAGPPLRREPLMRDPVTRALPANPLNGSSAGAGEFSVLPAAAGHYRLRLRLPGARQVELMGDFTGWEPVPLTRQGDESWELDVPLAPGSYRFNVRIDGGEWTVPAGVGRVDDDYGGTAGVLSIT